MNRRIVAIVAAISVLLTARSADQIVKVEPAFAIVDMGDKEGLVVGYSVAVLMTTPMSGNVGFSEVIETHQPAYPAEMLRAGVVGDVVVGCVAGDDGSIEDMKIDKSPDQQFSDACIAALRKWRLKPETPDPKATRERIRVRFVFTIYSE